jgi:ligand-binding sensor domain-containing protein
MVSFSRKRIFIFCVAVLFASGLAFCIYVWQAARRAVTQSAQAAASAGVVRVSVSPLRPAASRFEYVLNAPEFRSAAVFNGDVFVSSSSALFQYSEGRLKQSWYVGRDLPAARLLTLSVRTGIGTPELWIATEGAGILMYDGAAFRQMVAEPEALRTISAMLPLGNGQMVVGTPTAGVYLSDGKSCRVFHSQFSKTQVTSLAGDEDQLWIGTRADGAWLWRGGEARHVMAELPDKQVLAVASKGGEAWIGTPLGVTEFKDGKLNRRLADGIFAETLAEHDGKLWVATADQGSFAIPLDIAKPRPQLSSHAGEWDSVVAFAKFGADLVAVEPRTVSDLTNRQTLATAEANALTSGHITALHEDSRGRLWVGYFDRGIDVVPASNAGPVTHIEDDTLFCINRIKENPQDGSILAATANGLAVFDSGGTLRQVLTRESGLIANNITDVLFQTGLAAEPTLAIATPAGVSFVEDGSIASIYAFQGLVNNHVYTLADLDGTLYAGTLGGISTLKRGLVQASFTTANLPLLRQNWITASAVFKRHLFLGTYGSGVIGFDGGGAVRSFRAFAGQRIEISQNALLATDRALYAGTSGKGLAILRAGDERWQFVTAGLPSLNVTALDERGGRLYVGTDNGLVRISENNLLP